MAARKKSGSSGLTTRMKLAAPARDPPIQKMPRRRLDRRYVGGSFQSVDRMRKSAAPQTEIHAFIERTDDRMCKHLERGNSIEASLLSNPLSKWSSGGGVKNIGAHISAQS